MKRINIFIKNTGVSEPSQGTPYAAGYDLIATTEPKIVGNKYKDTEYWDYIDYIEYGTNVYIAPQDLEDYHTLLHPRSSVSKNNLVLANSIGLIDGDYRGQVVCRFKYIFQPEDFKLIYNKPDGHYGSAHIDKIFITGKVNENKIYKKGDKIIQLKAAKTEYVNWISLDNLDSTQRNDGGFGSTGK